MPGRDRRHTPICVGTNAVYRRAALEISDGGALVHNSEDVHTGFDLMAEGLRTKYVPVILAKGLCPSSLQGFFNRKHRWCTGSMLLLFSHEFWRAPIGLRPRLTFLAGQAYFLYTGLGLIVLPIPAILMVWLFPEKVLWWNYLLLVPAFLHNFVFLPRWHRTSYGLDAMRVKLIHSWAHLFAFKDRLTGRPLQWNPTGGTDRGETSNRLRLVKFLLVAWPLASFAVLVCGSAAHMSSATDLNYWPPLSCALLYLSTAVLCLRPLGETTYVRDPGTTVRSRDLAVAPAPVRLPQLGAP